MNNFQLELARCRFSMPRNRSIVVLANYRTGSTALCDMLHRITGYPNLDEIFHFRNRDNNYQGYQDYLAAGRPAIIKIMGDQIPPEQYHQSLFADNTIVGIYRRDRVAQITSFAVAYTSNVWHNHSHDPLKPQTQSFDPKWLRHHAHRLQKLQDEYCACRPFMNFELCYETVHQDLDRSGFDAMPKAKNYQELLAQCQEILLKHNMDLVNE